MKGTIASFRRARHHQYPNQLILYVDASKSKEDAEKLVGKEVSWTTSGKKVLKGKISAAHGAKGAVRAVFDTGVPGQALGTQVDIN